jgi:hypothetical protein
MNRRLRRGAALAATFALACSPAIAGAAAGAERAANPARLSVALDRTAALGAPTALDIDLRLDPRGVTDAQLTGVEFAYPRRLGVVSSGLGLASCTRPPSDFAQVLIEGPRLGGCPPNAVMGYGIARAIVRLNDGQEIPEFATVTLLSGTIEHGRLGLVVFVDGQHPFGAKLAFAGEAHGAASPYGGALTVRMPTVPGIEDLATISLVELRITIGSHAIRYYERRDGALRSYRPDGVELPASCRAPGFRFRARLRFSDGTRRAAETATPCPRPLAAPSGGR